MKELGINRYKERRLPVLGRIAKAKRLAYAQEHQNFDWTRVMFTDETRLTLDGSMPGWWSGEQGQRPPESCRRPARPPGSKGVMFWAAIWHGGRSNLIPIDLSVSTSPSKGMTGAIYKQQILEGEFGRSWRHFRKWWQGFGTVYAVEDNCRIHNTPDCLKTKKSMGLKCLKHPPYSPDLNPIEHMWAALKRRVYSTRPSDDTLQKMIQRAQKAWWEIPQSEVDNYILGMDKKMGLVIQHLGDNTLK